MPIIKPVGVESADATTREILTAVKNKMGMVPNLISTMAQSPAVANAYLGFSQALGDGRLSARMREQIALTVGEANSCHYCVSAHSVLAKGAGANEEDVLAARRGNSSDGKEQAALEFAQVVVNSRGVVGDDDVEQLRTSGFDDGEICEIVANVALNIFTNYFNHIAGTEIDFPLAPALATA